MNRDFHFREKIGVAIALAESPFTARLRKALAIHPWFSLTERSASSLMITDRSCDASPVLFLGGGHGQLVVLHCSGMGTSPRVRLPSCATTALATALKPLKDPFGIEAVQAKATLPWDLPPEQVEEELRQLLDPSLPIEVDAMQGSPSAEAQIAVLVQLKEKVRTQDLIQAWTGFVGWPQGRTLPSVTCPPVEYVHEFSNLPCGAVQIGLLCTSSELDYRFTLVSPDPLVILLQTAEALVVSGLIYW